MTMANLLCAALLLAGPLASQGKLIFLGDSWTDGGSKGILSGGQLVEDKLSNGEVDDGLYPPSPYYQGSFTNGPVWAEVTAENVGQKFDNLAAGGAGATSGAILVKPPYGYLTSPTKVPVRSLVTQAEALVSLKTGAVNSGIDFGIIFIGIDELYQATALKTASVNPTGFGSAVGKALSSLYSVGIKKYAVLTIPPLDKFPFAVNVSDDSVASAVSKYNDALITAIDSFNASNDGVTVLTYNTSALFESILSNPKSSEFGTPFTNTKSPARISTDGDLDTTQAAGTGLPQAANPAGYVFFDEVHGSKHLHHVLANDFSEKIGGQLNSAPSPAGTYT